MRGDWRENLYRKVKEDKNAVLPEDFDTWLEERMSMRYGKGSLIIGERDREVFEQYFVEGKTLQKIAEEMNVTKQYILQVKNRYIRKLRRADKKLSVHEWKYDTSGNVFSLPIPERAAKCFLVYDILTIEQLDKAIADGSIYQMRNMGKVTVRELMSMVAGWKAEQERKNVHSKD